MYRSRQVFRVPTANVRERRPLPNLKAATRLQPQRPSRPRDLIITWQAETKSGGGGAGGGRRG